MIPRQSGSQKALGEKPSDPPGVVLMCASGRTSPEHEKASRVSVAKRLAVLKGYEFGGDYCPGQCDPCPRYFVPEETLVGIERGRRMGVLSEADFFGGLVPYPFMATKTITHPLVNDKAAAPEGWSPTFAAQVRDVALSGFAAFAIEDARSACAELLKRGAARLKPGLGVGGKGQEIVSSPSDLDRALASLDVAELAIYGITIEENLQDVTTYSVGAVRFENLQITYCGTQRVTRDHRNEKVYGGSDLLVARGGFGELLRLNIAPEARLAIAKARVYDVAAASEIAGFIASRRNYDVAAGVDCRGRRRVGVLEQSWRIGGASPAEVAALEAFRNDPSHTCLRASCPEIYDSKHEPPPHACISFSGEDPEVGYLLKYSVVEKYEDTR